MVDATGYRRRGGEAIPHNPRLLMLWMRLVWLLRLERLVVRFVLLWLKRLLPRLLLRLKRLLKWFKRLRLERQW